MKKIFTIAAFTAAAILAVSCAKEVEDVPQEKGITAHASLQPVEATKAVGQHSYIIVWEDNDKIAVLDKQGSKASFKLTEGAGTTAGTFQQEGSDALTAPLAAYYPASVVADDKSLVWPATQADVANISNVPMMAESQTATGDVNFAFKHLGCVLQLVPTVINGTIDVKQIDITADQGLSGAFTVKDGAAVISNPGTTITTGDISAKGIKLSAAASYLNLAVPSGDFTNYKITITDTHSLKYSLSAANLTLKRAMVNKVTSVFDAQKGWLFEFTVNGHTIKVKRSDAPDIDKDVIINAYVEGDEVIITAYSLSGQHLKCTMSGGEFCTSQSKTDKLVYTFTISDISKDDIAIIDYAGAVSVSASPENAGTIEAEGDFYEGETVKLVSAPKYEYGIYCWKDEKGNVIGTGYDYSTRIPADVHSITAVFVGNLVLGGVFTVNDSGEKVRFTRGNLYYDGSSKIEQRQYYFNASDYTTATAHVSHFMWSKSISDATKLTISDSGTSINDVFFTNQSSFMVEGFNAGDCFALTDWSYLLTGRDASTVAGTANARFFKGTIRDEKNRMLPGLFIFPDVFTWPESVKTQPSGINDGEYRYPWTGAANSYSYNELKSMEEAGIVFLPATGGRYNGSTSISGANSTGHYWTPALKTLSEAYGLVFHESTVTPMDYQYRYYAYAVRLVAKVTE